MARTATEGELERAISWLQRCIVADARGDDRNESDNAPSTLFWLGRLAPESTVLSNKLGERGERLEPCAIGLRIRPRTEGPWAFTVRISACAWARDKNQPWKKTGPIVVELPIRFAQEGLRLRMHRDAVAEAFRLATGRQDIAAAVDVSIERRDGVVELVLEFVNVSELQEKSAADCNLYECSFEISGLDTCPFLLEGLPDAFRYDRTLPAIGLNCSVERIEGRLATTDSPETSRPRPHFTPEGLSDDLLTFSVLSEDPQTSIDALVRAHAGWGSRYWSPEVLDDRERREDWSAEMRLAAARGSEEFQEENRRLVAGAELIRKNADLLHAFKLMNRAMASSAAGRYHGWRAFQLGFLVANLGAVEDSSGDADVADIVWFATGGGKTETYLGLLIVAMLRDRMRGKLAGITAWSRFPLRMLSLQQTQRFADAIAAAELVRREAGIGGAPFSLGFFVGNAATPNRVPQDPKDDEPDANDPDMPRRYLVIDRCPFCRGKTVEIAFDQTNWTLEHRCVSAECSWPERALPFYVVDEEIYRFLPTVIVGTLDKAASISMQAAMRGFVGQPLGICSKAGHGFTYAVRSSRPGGCLVPDCRHPVRPLTGDTTTYAPSFRLQDELHLLRDSLGAVDAHYESLYDHLSDRLSGRRAKILGSSATLAGYRRQVRTLYARDARVFPQPGPAPGVGFWSSESEGLMRRFIALAPRGVTLEHAVDRILTVLQRSIRRLIVDRDHVVEEIGVRPEVADETVDLYGTDVVYGNTLRDLDALSRSAETQILVDGEVVQRSLTGRTEFSEVRRTLDELESPPSEFDRRVHVVMASSMMSHGVDIDRLNVMVMVGLPLGTAEFIQATARVGRRHPGLVIVVPKMARERDAAVYRTFSKFVEHADRLVEPIPITHRSRRVLRRTMAGLEMARVLMVHEPSAGRSLALPRELRKHWDERGFDPEAESQEIIEALHLSDHLDEAMQNDIRLWMDGFVRNVRDPPAGVRFVSEASPGPPAMRSLRDVEESVPIYGREDDL